MSQHLYHQNHPSILTAAENSGPGHRDSAADAYCRPVEALVLVHIVLHDCVLALAWDLIVVEQPVSFVDSCSCASAHFVHLEPSEPEIVG